MQYSNDGIKCFDEADPIKLVNFTKKFGNFTAVDALTLSIKSNEVFSILGHNGAGKTTVISMITGMIDFTSGEVSLYNKKLPE